MLALATRRVVTLNPVWQCVDFLDRIGIATQERPGATGVLAGLAIVGGCIHFDDDVCTAADLLHEAGHLAVLPSQWRRKASGDLDRLFPEMFADGSADNLDPDGPEMRAMLQCGEAEATAWAWAASMHIGLSPLQTIEDNTYYNEDGTPGGADVRLALQCGAYAGINGLQAAGWCAASSVIARHRGLPLYPKLRRWIQQ